MLIRTSCFPHENRARNSSLPSQHRRFIKYDKTKNLKIIDRETKKAINKLLHKAWYSMRTLAGHIGPSSEEWRYDLGSGSRGGGPSLETIMLPVGKERMADQRRPRKEKDEQVMYS
jgi:hypothetical protein